MVDVVRTSWVDLQTFSENTLIYESSSGKHAIWRSVSESCGPRSRYKVSWMIFYYTLKWL